MKKNQILIKFILFLGISKKTEYSLSDANFLHYYVDLCLVASQIDPELDPELVPFLRSSLFLYSRYARSLTSKV